MLGRVSSQNMPKRHQWQASTTQQFEIVISRLTYPREVRNTQETVHDKTECVVGGTIVEHGLVTTFMSKNPDTDEDESLENAVKSPQGASESERRCVLDLSTHVEHGADKDDVSHNVAHRSCR